MIAEEIIKQAEEKMEKAKESYEKRLTTIRTGRANPSSLDGVMVDYYGSMTPLKQLTTISVPEGNQLLIKPFDKGSLGAIEKAIIASNLGYNPANDGETIRIVVPALTEDRRKELVKQAKSYSEDAKVSVRNIRRETLEVIDDSEFPEDTKKGLEKDVQDIVNTYNKKIETILKEKEQELLTV